MNFTNSILVLSLILFFGCKPKHDASSNRQPNMQTKSSDGLHQEPSVEQFAVFDIQSQMAVLSEFRRTRSGASVIEDLPSFLGCFQLGEFDSVLFTSMVLQTDEGVAYLVHLDLVDEKWRVLEIDPFDDLAYIGLIEGNPVFAVKRNRNDENRVDYQAIIYLHDDRFRGVRIDRVSQEIYSEAGMLGVWPSKWPKPHF